MCAGPLEHGLLLHQLVNVRTSFTTCSDLFDITIKIIITIAVECGPLSSPTNGLVILTGTTFMHTATYSCNQGHVLEGDDTRTCQFDRAWSGEEPQCEGNTFFMRTECIVHTTSAPSRTVVLTSSQKNSTSIINL